MEIDEDLSVIEADPSKSTSTTMTLKYVVNHYILMLYLGMFTILTGIRSYMFCSVKILQIKIISYLTFNITAYFSGI